MARIAAERPDAIVVSGDLPWHGGVAADYEEFRTETEIWRKQRLRILPALGNHEFAQCAQAECLAHWWTAFPELRGQRWYTTDLGGTIRILSLDSASSLLAGSEQRQWIEQQLATLPRTAEFVLISLHHPPVADIQTRLRVDHNPRPNEIALAEYLKEVAATASVRFVVVAGHIHNYERFLRDDVVYLVSGGGGAVPYEVERTPADLYQTNEFPNFHYVKLSIRDGTLTGEMPVGRSRRDSTALHAEGYLRGADPVDSCPGGPNPTPTGLPRALVPGRVEVPWCCRSSRVATVSRR